MKKVGIIFWARRLTSRAAGECYLLILSFAGLFSFVSVPHVIANMPPATNVVSVWNFILMATTHTHIIVQCVLAVMCLSLVLIFSDIIRNFVGRVHFRNAVIS